jgi:hypothetical protein
LFAGGPDAEDTAGILGAFVVVEEVMGELAVAARHALILPG